MIDRTDEETGELVREWLQRYGLSIIAGIVLAIAMIGAYEWWQNRQVRIAGETSARLIALNSAVSENDLDQAVAIYQEMDSAQLKPLASLLMAVAYSNNRQQDKAVTYFEQAAKGKDPLVVQTANWQLAQTYIADKNYTAAEQTLQALKGSAYEQQIPLLQALIARAQDNRQAALDAYRKALDGNPDQLGFIQAQIAAIEGEIAVQSEAGE